MKLKSWIPPIIVVCIALFPLLAAGAASRSTDATTSPLAFVEANFDTALKGASGIALSPDGQFLYVASREDSAISVFRRNTTSGALLFVEAQRDGMGGADGLYGATGLAISPDGGHVYVASQAENALAVYERDAINGNLIYKTEYLDGQFGAEYLSGAASAVVSPDGRFVYVASTLDNAITVFERDRSNGLLTYVEEKRDGIDSVDGLGGATQLALSPDGGFLYTTGFNDDAVAFFVRDELHGTLEFWDKYLNSYPDIDGLDGAQGLALSPDGASLYVTGAVSNSVAVFSRNTGNGVLTFVRSLTDNAQNSLTQARSVQVSPDGTHVYIASSGDHSIAIYARNPVDGDLSPAGLVQNGDGGIDDLQLPYFVLLSEDGKHLYVSGHERGTLGTFKRNFTSGMLDLIEIHRSGAGLEGASGVAVRAGNCVYAAGEADDALVFFTRQPATGKLIYEGQWPDGFGGVNGLDGIRAVAISPDGQHIYVAGHEDDAVVIFSPSADCSEVFHIDTILDTDADIEGLDGAQALAVSTDGERLYVASEVDDALVVFERNPVTGQLTFIDAGGVFYNNVGDVEGLDGAYSIAVFPDQSGIGEDVYVAGSLDNAVAHFHWNGSKLLFVTAAKDGIESMDGLIGASAVAVSPDGEYVYAASHTDNAVVVLTRNSQDGSLTYHSHIQDGSNDVEGLAGARALAVSPDGKTVYVAGQEDDALVVLSRDPASGSLLFEKALINGVEGVAGLDGASGIVLSADGNSIYVAGSIDNAVAVFAIAKVYLPVIITQ